MFRLICMFDFRIDIIGNGICSMIFSCVFFICALMSHGRLMFEIGNKIILSSLLHCENVSWVFGEY